MTILIENRNGDSICSHLATDLPIRAVAHAGWLMSLALCCTLFLSSQIKGTDDFCQPSDAVWQMSQHLLSPWFIGWEWPQPQGRTHQKGQALVKGSYWMPTPSTTFIPSLLGPHILLLVIVWPSVVFRGSLTTPLSKHGVCAKCRHLRLAPLIRPCWVSSVRSSANSFEELTWQRFPSTGNSPFLSLISLSPTIS